MDLLTTISRWIVGVSLACLAGVAFLASSTAHARPPAAPGPDFAAIDAYVQAQMKDIGLPGLALGIVRGDEIVYAKGYGIADPSGRPVTAQTPFRLASLMKSVTALAVMQRVEAGQIELDAPVRRYIPWFRIADESASAAITVRHLLNQTSGISSATGNEMYPSRAMLDWTPEQKVRELGDNALAHPAGTTFQYSNVNYTILALVVETVSGQTFESYVQEHVFTPLDMRHATLYRAEALPPDGAVGYRQWFGLPVAGDVPSPRSANGSGGLIASAEDMTHFLIAQRNKGRYERVAVLSPEGFVEMHRPVARDGDSDSFYAMGWEVETIDGLTTSSHTGDHADFHADMALTSDGWGIVVMTNANGLLAGGRPGGITAGVTSLLRGQEPPANRGILALRAIVLGLMALVALQIAGMVWSLAVLRRWFRFRTTDPARLPQGWRGVGRSVVLPLVANLALTFAIAVGFPAVAPGGLSLQGFVFNYPDVGYTMVTSVVVAVVWMVRTGLAYVALRGAEPD